MSGDIIFKSDIIDRNGTFPADLQADDFIRFTDKDDDTLGFIRGVRTPEGRTGIQIFGVGEYDGQEKTNGILLGVEADGTRKITVTEPIVWRKAIGNGSTSDFMRADGTINNTLINGYLNAQYPNINLKASNNGVSDTTWPGICVLSDSNDLRAAFFGSTIGSSGTVGASMFAYNYNSSGTRIGSCYLTCYIDKNGNSLYSVSDSAAFRNALGMTTWSSVTQANYITLDSNWSLESFSTSYNAALKRMRVTLYVKTSVARNAGNIQAGTVKTGYRPPGRVVIPSSSSAADAGTAYLEASGSLMIAVPTGGVSANKIFYFAGEYSIL